VEVETLIEIPEDKLKICDRVPVPAADSEWLDVPAQYIEVLQVLDRCNDQIHGFWTWYRSQMQK